MLRLLARLGYVKVEVASDGQEAFDKILLAIQQSQPFDLVFMDMQMPICTGTESTILIRNSEVVAGLQPFIVAMSAGVFEEDQQACVDAGMDGFLPKPLKVPELIAMLKRFWVELQEGKRGGGGMLVQRDMQQ